LFDAAEGDDRHGTHEQCCVQAEPDGDRGEEPGEAEIEPRDRDEAAAGARQHAHRIGVHRRDAAASRLHVSTDRSLGRVDVRQPWRAADGSFLTLRWREPDSNHQSRARRNRLSRPP
jgi:hypothetical protein